MCSRARFLDCHPAAFVLSPNSIDMAKIPDFPFAHSDVVSKTVKDVDYLSTASLAADRGVITIKQEAEDLATKYKVIITALGGLSDEIAKGATVGSLPSCCISLSAWLTRNSIELEYSFVEATRRCINRSESSR